MTPDRRKALAIVTAIIAGIVAAFLSYELLIEFHDWNRLQSCATAGGRNCDGYSR